MPPSSRTARVSSAPTTPGGSPTLTPSASNESLSSQEGDVPMKIMDGVYLVAAPQNTPEFDIVLVNGFTGDQLSTWYHAAKQLYWPKDLLHSHFPSARILSVDIAADANISRSSYLFSSLTLYMHSTLSTCTLTLYIHSHSLHSINALSLTISMY
jgi:hypothetical protein